MTTSVRRFLLLPPVLLLVHGLILYLLTRLWPSLTLHVESLVWLAILTGLTGLILMLWVALLFWRHHTTIDPRKPDKSRHLVTHGPFRFSRNPIYLADAMLLTALGLYLGSLLTPALVFSFVTLISRYQIRREEQQLARRFGQEYRRFCQKTPRWL